MVGELGQGVVGELVHRGGMSDCGQEVVAGWSRQVVGG